jgi:hypothetical protein
MVYNSVHESPSQDLILSQMNPVHTFKHLFSKVYFYIILSPTLEFLKQYITWGFYEQKFVYFLVSPCVLHAHFSLKSYHPT